MNKIHSLVIACLFLSISLINAQDFNNYKSIAAEGTIPKDFIMPSAQKYKNDILKINEGVKRKEAKSRKRFALETNFVLDDMLQSGLVLFNDKISLYLNQVASTLVQNGETKFSKLKVYTLRSASVNAFATGRGEVFVTLGLLAQMENEAQLAFVLAHELTHIEEQHSLELFLETQGVGKNTSNKEVLKNGRLNEKALGKHNYKKELETEADEKGLARFLKTNYSSASIRNVFDVLKYSYLPFDDLEFNYNIFQNESYVLPESYRLATVKAISGEKEDKDDAKSSHPNLSARKTIMEEALKNVNDKDKVDYIVSKERFLNLQQIARFELPMLYVRSEQYAQAVYTSFLLLEKNPESIYLKKCVAKALYYHAKYKNDSDYTFESMYKDIEGQSQRVHYLLEQIKDKEAAVLAMRYAYQALAKAPNDSELKTITRDLAIVLAKKEVGLSDFKALSEAKIEKDTTLKIPLKDSTQLTKLEKIQNQNFKTTIGSTFDYWRFAFSEFKDQAEFVKIMQEGVKKQKERTEIDDYYATDKGKREWEREQSRNKKNGFKLGIKKIVVINPHYTKIDERKETALDHIGTEEGQTHLNAMIKEVAAKSDLKVDILDINTLSDKQIAQFNNIRYLNEWFSEQVDKYNMTLTPGSQQAVIDSIAAKYGTDYFLWTGVVSLREKNRNFWWIPASLLYPVTTPFAVYAVLKPHYEMLHYAILYDVKTGRRQVLKFDFFKEKDSDAMIKAHTYDVFAQIKAEDDSPKPKKKK